MDCKSILIFSPLIAPQLAGNQSFTQTVKGLARSYNIVILTCRRPSLFLAFSSIPNVNIYSIFNEHLVDSFLSIVSASIGKSGFSIPSTRDISCTSNVSNNKPRLPPFLSEYTPIKFFFKSLRNLLASFFLSLFALYTLVRLKLFPNNCLFYGYEIYGCISLIVTSIACLFAYPTVSRFQGVPIQVSNRGPLFLLFRIAYSYHYDLIICANDGTQGDKVISSFNTSSPFWLIPNGLTLTEYLPNVQPRPSGNSLTGSSFNIFSVCKLKPVKRVLLHIPIFESIMNLDNNQYSNPLRLTIIGDGSDASYVRSQRNSSSFKSSITLHGGLPYPDAMMRFYENASCLISTFMLSNLSNTTLESMYLRIPVFSFRNTGLESFYCPFLTDTLLAEDANIDQLARLIHRYISSKELRSETYNRLCLLAPLLITWRARMSLEIEKLAAIF